MSYECVSCSGALDSLLQFQDQPFTAHFLKSPLEDSPRFTLNLGACQDCSLLQLLSPPDADSLKPLHFPIQFREPESHLDEVVDRIIARTSPEANILGVTYKDASTLQRLEEKGYTNCTLLTKEDYGIQDHLAGNEKIIEILSSGNLGSESLKNEMGAYDVVVARHILEHSARPSELIASLGSFLHDTGYLVLESPDCSIQLEQGIPTMLWEEHVTYFNRESLQNFLSRNGMQSEVDVYPNGIEPSLVAFAGLGEGRTLPEKDMVLPYVSKVREQQQTIPYLFSELAEEGSVAFFGSGHHTSSFINFFNLRDHVSYIVDDNTTKQGHYLAGTGLAIRPSSFLYEHPADFVFNSFSPASEQKVLQRHKEYFTNHQLFSIFPRESNSLTQIMEYHNGRV